MAIVLLLSLSGCVFEGEPEKNCYYEATIGCGPGCTPRVVKEMIVCPSEPTVPTASAPDGGQ